MVTCYSSHGKLIQPPRNSNEGGRQEWKTKAPEGKLTGVLRKEDIRVPTIWESSPHCSQLIEHFCIRNPTGLV